MLSDLGGQINTVRSKITNQYFTNFESKPKTGWVSQNQNFQILLLQQCQLKTEHH